MNGLWGATIRLSAQGSWPRGTLLIHPSPYPQSNSRSVHLGSQTLYSNSAITTRTVQFSRPFRLFLCTLHDNICFLKSEMHSVYLLGLYKTCSKCISPISYFILGQLFNYETDVTCHSTNLQPVKGVGHQKHYPSLRFVSWFS